MATDYPFDEIYAWARANIGQRVLLGYDLQRVSAQTEGQLLLLLRLPWLKVPSVELEITYDRTAKAVYELVFRTLPLHDKVPQPTLLRPGLTTQQAIIDWITTTRY